MGGRTLGHESKICFWKCVQAETLKKKKEKEDSGKSLYNYLRLAQLGVIFLVT